MQRINHYFFLLLIFCSTIAHSETELKASNTLSLKKAIELGLQLNPSAIAFETAKRTAEAARIINSSPPAPGLSIGVDEVAGSGPFAGTRSMKSFIGLSQRILTGGKFSISKEIAATEEKAALSEIAENRLNFQQATGEQFFKMFLLEKQVELADHTLQLARQTYEAVEKRLIAGDIPAIDLTRSKVNLSIAETSFRKATRELETARKTMAATWNSATFDFSKTHLATDDFINFRLDDELNEGTQINHPALLKASEIVQKAELEKRLAHAASTPDMILKTGLSRFKESGHHASSFEVEFDLPSRRSVRGRKLEAAAESDKAKLHQQAIETHFKMQIFSLRQEIVLLREEIESFRTNLMPAAEQAMNDSSIAYREGEQSLMEIFDTRKTMIEAAATEAILYHDLFNRVFTYALLTGRENELLKEEGN